MVPFGGWEMPLAVSERHHRRAPGLPGRRGGLRRQPPGHGARQRPAGAGPAPVDADQRPGQDRPGPGPVHPPARRRRRVGPRRHHRVVDRRRDLRRHAERLQHRPGSRRPRRRRRHQRAGHHRHPGADRPAQPVGGLARGGRGRPVPGGAASPGGATPAWPPAPATPARTGWSARFPAASPRRSGRRCWRPGSSRPGWAPGTPCAWRPPCRCTATSWDRVSPPCRPASAGWWRGRSRRASRAGTPCEREKAAGVARRLAGLATEGRQPPRAGAAVLADGATRRRGDQRQLFPGARPRHRPGVRAA